jgi:hypothetical protein
MWSNPWISGRCGERGDVHIPSREIQYLPASRKNHTLEPLRPNNKMASSLSRTEILNKVYKMVPPMLEKFHKGDQIDHHSFSGNGN